MALGSTNLSLRDIFYEIYKRYPNAGEAVDLESLVNASILQDKTRPHSIGQFANYTHAANPKVQVDVYSNVNANQDYHNVSWRFYFDKPLLKVTDIGFREKIDPSGEVLYLGYVTAAAGSTEIIYTTSYQKASVSFNARIEVLDRADYDLGTAWFKETLITAVSTGGGTISSSSSSRSLY